MDLRGKVAIVTGAGSGIGASTAEEFAQGGAKVGVLSRTPEEVGAVADRIARSGGEAIPLTADVADPAAVLAAVERLTRKWGRLDIAVANAGINGVRAPIENIAIEEFDQVTAANQRGTFITIQACVPHLRKHGGAIVVVSSVDGNVLFNDPGAVVYAATKAAQVAMVKVLAIELAQHGIRINAVLPGSIATQIGDSTTDRGRDEILGAGVKFGRAEIPLTRGKEGRPEQVARAILFLASDAADHITGAQVVVDGGQSLVS